MSGDRELYKKSGNFDLDKKNINKDCKVLYIEKEISKKGFKKIAGTDNSGRGAIAGPIVAATVILPEDFNMPYIRNFNRLANSKKEELY